MATPTKRTPGSETDETHLRLAVLIDADNAQATVIEALLAEVARFGDATVRRIYGDFTAPTSASWKKVLQRNAIKPVQQFAYSTGKNSTDSTLIIDAMDLLYTGNFDGFALVTSDSDFTGLAMRLREEGLMVFGFGERKTPEAFRNACHRFVFVEVLRNSGRAAEPEPRAREPSRGPGRRPCQPQETADAAPRPKLPKKFVLERPGAVRRRRGLGAPGHVRQLPEQAAARLRPAAVRLQEALGPRARPHGPVHRPRSAASSGSNQRVLYLRAR